VIETLEAIQSGDSESRVEKAMSGGAVKAGPRCSERSPRGVKTQEGIELVQV